MAQPRTQPGFDAAAFRARTVEDVVVDGEIVRHRLSSRIIHWTVAISCLVCLLTGLPIWTPVFGWMAPFYGGLAVCRVLHPFSGAIFFLAAAAMYLHWASDMTMSAKEKSWIGPKLLEYLRDEANHAEIGKYNGGQKVFFYTSFLSALGLIGTGIVLWFPTFFPRPLREIAILVHDLTFALFLMSIIFHVYLATTAEPGTFHSMTRGTVSRAWARIHHPRWYRDLLAGRKGAP